MKRTKLETVLKTMELGCNAIAIPEEIRVKALGALDRMLAVA
jgi:quinolinate synthase